MIVKQLILTRFKGQERTVNLDKLNLIFGDNGTGKTAILDALTFAITGSTKLGGRLEDTQQLASPGGCMVDVALEPDFQFHRAIYKDAASKTMKKQLSIKGMENLKLNIAEQTLRNQVGHFAPTFDINVFLNLSSDKRRDFILQLCNAGEKSDPEALYHKFIMEYCGISMGHATLGAHVNNHKSTFPESSQTELRDYVLGKLSDAERSAVVDLMETIKPDIRGDVSRAISGALEAAKVQTNGAKISKDANNQAVRSISERKEAIKTVSESADQLKERKKELTERKEGRIAKLNERRGMDTSIDDRKRQVHDHELILDNIALNLKNLAPMDIAELKEKIEDNFAKIVNLESKLDDEVIDTAKMLQEVNTANGAYHELNQTANKIERDYKNAQEDRDRLSAELERATNDPWNKAFDLIMTVQAKFNKQIIESESFKKLFLVIKEQTSRPQILLIETGLRNVVVNISNISANHKDALQKTIEAKAAWEKLDDEYKKAEQSASKKKMQQQQFRDKIDVLDKQNEIDDTAIKTRETYLNQQQNDSNAAHEQIVAHKQALEELLQKCDAYNVAELETEIEGLKNTVAEIENKLEDIGKFDQLTQSYNECIQKAEEENTKYEVGKKFCAAVRQVRETIMDSLIKPLMSRMENFLSIAAPGHRPYISLESDRHRAIFQLDWIVNDKILVPLPAMSGGESVTFCAALAYAMVDLANPPLKLLMLELGECDDKTFFSLIRAIGNVCLGDGMQAIVATHLDRDIRDDRWNVIKLTHDHIGRGSQKDKAMFLVEDEPEQVTSW